MSDNINHPKHYETGPFECIELSSRYSFSIGNAVKYVWRYPMKNGAEDLRKAQWYLRYASAHGESARPLVGLSDGDGRRPVHRLLDLCMDYPGFAPTGAFWLALSHGDVDGMLRVVDGLVTAGASSMSDE